MCNCAKENRICHTIKVLALTCKKINIAVEPFQVNVLRVNYRK
jgi:hypothetical protein